VKPPPAAPPPAAAAQQRPHPAELSDRWFISEGLAETPPAPRRSEQPRRQEPQRPTDPPPQRRAVPSSWDDGQQEWAPTWETRHEEPGRRPAHTHSATASDGRSDQASWLAQYNQSEPTYGSRAYLPQSSRPDPGSRPAMPSAPAPPTTPVPAARAEDSAGGHRRAEPDAAEQGGGRRRRADGQPSWQETVGRSAEESGGSHASGRSVSELLANNGHDTSPRRRRRRED
jgi:hypothetical protein